MGTQSTWGLISRVSSRTYRFLEMASEQRGGRSGLAQAWLLLFNVGMVAGWASIGYSLIGEMLTTSNYKLWYHLVEKQLIFFQTAAVFEVLHSAIGLVRANPIITAGQVASRVFIVWFVLKPMIKVQINLGCAF